MEAALGRRGRRLLLLLLPLTAALQLGPSAALPLGQVPEGRRGGGAGNRRRQWMRRRRAGWRGLRGLRAL